MGEVLVGAGATVFVTGAVVSLAFGVFIVTDPEPSVFSRREKRNAVAMVCGGFLVWPVALAATLRRELRNVE